METPISFFVCTAVAFLTLALGLYHFIVERPREIPTLDESLSRLEQIRATLETLPEMDGQQRRAACRTVTRAIRDDCHFLIYLLCECYFEEDPRNKEVKRLSQVAFRETQKVLSSVNWLLFLLRFWPSRVKDCSGIFDATFRHYRSWFAYIRLLHAQYPDLYGNLSIPEENA
jgi:hypothetical protein